MITRTLAQSKSHVTTTHSNVNMSGIHGTPVLSTTVLPITPHMPIVWYITLPTVLNLVITLTVLLATLMAGLCRKSLVTFPEIRSYNWFVRTHRNDRDSGLSGVQGIQENQVTEIFNNMSHDDNIITLKCLTTPRPTSHGPSEITTPAWTSSPVHPRSLTRSEVSSSN